MKSVFGHNIKSDTVRLYVVEAISVFIAVYGILIWGLDKETAVDHGRLGLLAVMLALSAGVVLSASGLYQPDLLTRTKRFALGCTFAVLLFIVAAWLCLHITGAHGLGLSTFRQAAVLALAAIAGALCARLGHALATRSGLAEQRLLVIRDPAASVLQVGETGTKVAPPGSLEVTIPRATSAKVMQALRPDWVRAQHIWAIVVPATVADSALRRHCEATGVRLLTADEFLECRLTRVACERLPHDWLATASSAQPSQISAALHRLFDIATALSILIFTLPVMLVAAVLIRFDSKGPIFYRQERTGLHGRSFNLYKFRSMVVDAEVGGAPKWATLGDPRVTPFGRFMRLTRIDELPQLLNVLRGEMAMVGPRPERPAFVAQLSEAIPHYQDRLVVKPGLTGWAQVNYPYGASVEDARMKLAYDLYYVRRRSLFLDLLILISTVRVVLFQEGAR